MNNQNKTPTTEENKVVVEKETTKATSAQNSSSSHSTQPSSQHNKAHSTNKPGHHDHNRDKKAGDKRASFNKNRKPNKSSKPKQAQPKMEFEEKLVTWKRVSKTTKGGRHGRIWTLVVVGNRKGSVGYGIGKAEEFPDAMKKAVKNALKNVVKVKINANGTVYHENLGKHGASSVLIKPAKVGIGIIAGGPIKTVLELAGYTDVYSKNLGSNTAMNMVSATIKALLNQRTPEEVAKVRGKKISELY